MGSITVRRRTKRGLASALGAIVLASMVAGGVNGQGLTADQLAAQGWTCFSPPVGGGTVCFGPGLGRPIPGDPDPRPTYNFRRFDASGAFLGTGHFIRADLYQGQPCTGGSPYVLRAVIGYYECIR